MEFSNKWYTVYSIEEPKIKHEIQLEIFKKLEDTSGNNYWIDLTKGNPLQVGIMCEKGTNDDYTIIVQYHQLTNIEECSFSLKVGKEKLLIPDDGQENNGNIGEYLILPNENIDETGNLCNIAGVGYEAFVKQPNRCKMERNSCFQNQPEHFWQYDHNLDKRNIKGCYFLKNFASIPNDGAIKGDCENNNKSLNLYYKEKFESLLKIKIKNDNNFILYKNKFATITEVYVDATFYKKIVITVKITNNCLVSGLFSINLMNFPLNLPASLNTVHSKIVLIPPQHQHIFQLELECEALYNVKDIFGHVQIRNNEDNVIAWRTIRLNSKDRCICLWYCKCACLLYDGALKCKLLQLNEYYSAGFQGSPPLPQEFIQYTIYDDMLSIMTYFLLFLFIVFFLFGLLKAVFGLIFIPIGLYGLDVILDLPKPIKHYYEHDLEYRTVIYDENGWPIHPDTRKPVHNTKLITEFFLNLLFFFIYPLALIFFIVRKVCFSTYRNSNDSSNYCKYCEEHFICTDNDSFMEN